MPTSTLLDSLDRTKKPRKEGITIMLDKGLGPRAVADLGDVSGSYCDYGKIAWGSALITGKLETKLEAYRAGGIEPLLGGTLFEYCYIKGKLDHLLAFTREHRTCIEVSDGVIDLSRPEKLKWIEAFAKEGKVFSEVGGKVSPHQLQWVTAVEEELAAGAVHVVIEGRELGPTSKEIREDLFAILVDAFPAEKLVFEALERYQQVWLIKRLGSNVNLGNILPGDLMTLESFRLGLKEHTLLHFAEGAGGKVDR